tara:strand:+ start:502 stop:1218 length:717 start_codon:yes stop_codon:yes gene_type:complete
MVYFLGRDIAVAISTESTTALDNVEVGGLLCISGNAGDSIVFAADMNASTFSSFTSTDGLVDDVTGIDISVGAMDEDITFVGQKGTAKVEQKKEITVTLTRKKKDDVWGIAYNGPTQAASLENFSSNQSFGARWGLDKTGSTTAPYLAAGLDNPKDMIIIGTTNLTYGYRLHVQLKSGSATDGTTQTLSIPNCTINSYTVSLNADGITEESMEFGTTQSILHSIGNNINNTLTTQAAF